MDETTRQKCISLTSDFYAEVADSFSSTRQSAWHGWQKVIEAVELPNEFSVLDLACGNLRFEEFLVSAFSCSEDGSQVATPSEACLRGSKKVAHALCIDNCEELLPWDKPDFVEFWSANIVTNEAYVYSILPETEGSSFDMLGNLASEHETTTGSLGSSMSKKLATTISSTKTTVPLELPADSFDLSVCFGFFHHVPGFDERVALLKKMLDATKLGGYVAIALWQFMKSERIAANARAATKNAVEKFNLELEPNDNFLNWQDRTDVFRYCHNFDDDEAACLASSVSDAAELVASFNEDGKDHNLNKYLVFKKK